MILPLGDIVEMEFSISAYVKYENEQDSLFNQIH